ncbi:MAG: hypothetical protein AAFP15_02100 [Bacteroidota bacterium]
MKFQATSNRVNAPEGTYPVVCVDVIERGYEETMYGTKERGQFVFETPHAHPDFGDPLTVQFMFNVSFGKNAKLRGFMEDWRGRPYSGEEAKAGVDPELCIGRTALVSVVHEEKGENVYANIKTVMPLPAGMEALKPSGSYTRVKDRDGGWDLRSPNSTAGGTGRERAARPAQATPVQQPPSGTYTMVPDDELLPF